MEAGPDSRCESGGGPIGTTEELAQALAQASDETSSAGCGDSAGGGILVTGPARTHSTSDQMLSGIRPTLGQFDQNTLQRGLESDL